MIMRVLHDEGRDEEASLSFMDSYYGVIISRRMAGDFRALHLDADLAFSMVSPEFADRPLKTLCLFDVDGTLTLARQVCVFFASHRICTNHSTIEGISRDD